MSSPANNKAIHLLTEAGSPFLWLDHEKEEKKTTRRELLLDSGRSKPLRPPAMTADHPLRLGHLDRSVRQVSE